MTVFSYVGDFPACCWAIAVMMAPLAGPHCVHSRAGCAKSVLAFGTAGASPTLIVV